MQVFPADELLVTNSRIRDELICLPVVKVSGQQKEFLKPVVVEIDYCTERVNNVDEKFIPVGQTLSFNSQYGVMLQSYKEIPGQFKWKNLADGESSTIYRVQKDKIRITYAVKHFCR